MLDYQNIQISDTLRHTLHSWHAVQVPCLPYLALCLPRVPVNQRALALLLATQLWYLPKTSLIIAFNPANAPGGWGQTRVCPQQRCFREDGMRLETRVTPSAQLGRHTNISVVMLTYAQSARLCCSPWDVIAPMIKIHRFLFHMSYALWIQDLQICHLVQLLNMKKHEV